MTTTEAQAPEAAPETPTDEAGDTPQTPPTETPAPDKDDAGETPLDEVTDWDELSKRLESADKPQPEAEPAEEEPKEPEQAETPAPETEDTDEPQDDPAKPLPKNFRLHTEDPKRAKLLQLMRQNPDGDPILLAKLAGFEAPKDDAAPAAPKAEEPKADPFKPLRDEIADLEEKIGKAEEAFEPTGKLAIQLAKKLSELSDAQRDHREQVNSERAYQADYAEARTEAAARHPEIAKSGTKQNRLYRMALAEQEQDPAFFTEPDYPLRLIAKLESEFPEAFPTKRPTAPATPAAVPARKPAQATTPSRPMGQTAPATAGTPRKPSLADLEQRINSASFDELANAADMVGTRIPSKR